MARINIEDSIHKDIRFDELKQKLGSRFTAIGALYYAWELAQEWFLQPGGRIPLSEWEKNKIPNEIIEVGLAEVEEGRWVRVKGSDQQFAWLRQRSEAGRKNKRPAKSLGNPVNDRSLPFDSVKPLSLSHSLSLSKNKLLTHTENNNQYELSSNNKNTMSFENQTTHPLIEIWNSNRNNLPEAKALNAERKRKAQARWKENPSSEYWTEVVRRLAASKFHNGDNDRGWRADFDFLIKPGTHLKAMETLGRQEATKREWRTVSNAIQSRIRPDAENIGTDSQSSKGTESPTDAEAIERPWGFAPA